MMRKKTRKKGRGAKQSSLAKNMALLFLSLGLLTGVSLVFSYFGTRSELSLDPIHSTWKNTFSNQESVPADKEKTQPKTSSLNPVDLKFYDILTQKDDPASPADETYTIQVGAFKNRDKAVAFAKDLKDKSRLSFRVDRVGRMYCVRWNTFTTQESAAQDCEKLSAKIQHTCRVMKM